MIKAILGGFLFLIGAFLAVGGLVSIDHAHREDGDSQYSCHATQGESTCSYRSATPTATVAALAEGLAYSVIGAAGIAGGAALIAGGRSGAAQPVVLTEPQRPISFNPPGTAGNPASPAGPQPHGGQPWGGPPPEPRR